MDISILKYVDILIGLALVMVLLSPIVTAITQIFLVLTLARTRYLLRGLQLLIGHFDPVVMSCDVPVAAGTLVVTVRDRAGNVEPNVRVDAGKLGSGTTNAEGAVEFPYDGAKADDVKVRLSTSNGPRAHAAVEFRLRRSLAQPAAFHETTDSTGTTTICYTGTQPYGCHTAIVSVHASNGQAVSGAVVEFRVGTATVHATTDALGQAVFVCPGERPVPEAYQVQAVIVDANGQPLSGAAVDFQFQRNADHDRVVQINADARGTAVFPQVGPKAGVTFAQYIAEAVLRHPLIGKPDSWLTAWQHRKSGIRGKCGEVLQREELVGILLAFAGHDGPSSEHLDPTARQLLRKVIQANGVADPTATLAQIRTNALQLEHDEPKLSTHQRLTKAVIQAANTTFVAIINDWYDQTMDRVTSAYTLRARIWTVLAALVVSIGVQLDSLDLVRRLSVDDKLRNSLVQQAAAQQQRIEKALTETHEAPPADLQEEIQLARAKREEIEKDLATLRKPGMDILPDHFLWEKITGARLMRNESWTRPFPRTLQLVVGNQPYPIAPRWRKDPLEDLAQAINNASTGVRAVVYYGPKADPVLSITARDPEISRIELRAAPGDTAAAPHTELQRVQVTMAGLTLLPDTGHIALPQRLDLVLGEKHFPLSLPAAGETTLVQLQSAIDQQGVPVDTEILPGGHTLRITSRQPGISGVTLLRTPGDPYSNLLDAPDFELARLSVLRSQNDPPLPQKIQLVVEGSVCTRDLPPHSDLAGLKNAIDSCGARVMTAIRTPQTDYLQLEPGRAGITSLQLRWNPGHPETNMLDTQPVLFWDLNLLAHSWRGVLFSWMLLSLGAPFWYDALKNLLKLRPSLAKKEEEQRMERQTQQT
jgi:hypothetical protein